MEKEEHMSVNFPLGDVKYIKLIKIKANSVLNDFVGVEPLPA